MPERTESRETETDRRICTECNTRWTGVEVPVVCPECESTSSLATVDHAVEVTADWAVEAIRYDERVRLAQLLTESSDVIGQFVGDGPSAIRVVAYMLTLKP